MRWPSTTTMAPLASLTYWRYICRAVCKHSRHHWLRFLSAANHATEGLVGRLLQKVQASAEAFFLASTCARAEHPQHPPICRTYPPVVSPQRASLCTVHARPLSSGEPKTPMKSSETTWKSGGSKPIHSSPLPRDQKVQLRRGPVLMGREATTTKLRGRLLHVLSNTHSGSLATLPEPPLHLQRHSWEGPQLGQGCRDSRRHSRSCMHVRQEGSNR